MAEDIAFARENVTRHRPLLLLALLALVLCGGLVWRLASAHADSASPSPAADVTLRLGWTSEPDNLNPFIGYADSTYEIWRINYSTVWGYNQDNGPGPDLAIEMPTNKCASAASEMR